MKTLEIITFLALASALHFGAWFFAPSTEGTASAGGGGQDAISVAAATPSQAEMITAWKTGPAVSDQPMALSTAPLLASAPRVPTNAPSLRSRPGPPPALPAPDKTVAPRVDETPPPPPVVQSAKAPKAPATRPKARPAQSKASSAQAEKRAQGTAKRVQRDTGGTTALNSGASDTSRALRAAWGARIQDKVRRNMRYPRGVSATGTAKLTLMVAANGKLRDLQLIRSSGDALLDREALRAVARAGRFARAPKGLKGEAHAFNLSLNFAR